MLVPNSGSRIPSVRASLCAEAPWRGPFMAILTFLLHGLHARRLWGAMAAAGLVVLMARFPDVPEEPSPAKGRA